MKIKKVLLVLASAALTGTLLAACQGSNNETETYDNGAISKIEGTNLQYVALEQEVDLDDYYQVTLDDNTTSSKYGIENTNDAEDITIEGHKVTAHKVGDYEIKLVCEGFSTYVMIHCKSDMNIQWIELVNDLNNNNSGANNYTIELGSYNSLTGIWDYDVTYAHNPNYIAIYNKNDPGETATDEDGNVGPNSTILAKLSDGYAYWGSFDTDDKPVFENGKCNFNNYYISLPMKGVSGMSFTSNVDTKTGVETLEATAAIEQNFLNYGISSFPENYGYTCDSLVVNALEDEDEDGKIDAAYLTAYVIDNASQKTEIWTDIKLTDIGSTSIASLETAIADASYVPSKLDVTPIKNAFAKATENGNYTITQELYPCDSEGNLIPSSEIESYEEFLLGYYLGTAKNTIVTTVTSDGIDSVWTQDGEKTMSIAYWNEDGKSYGGTWGYEDGATTPTTTKTELENITNVFDNETVKSYTASNVTDAGIENTDWSTRVANDDGTYSYDGSVGDNTTEGQTNLFYQQLFDQDPIFVFTMQSSGEKVGIGTLLTMDGGLSYTDHSTCSFTVSSSYESATFNPTTGELSVSALIYLPLTGYDIKYYKTAYTISDIGTTTNDFTGYVETASEAA